MRPAGLDRAPGQQRHAAGFTLVEVLVALGMVSVALVAGLSSSMMLTRYAERQTEVLLAQFCAQNTLAALRLATRLSSSFRPDKLLTKRSTFSRATNH